MRSAYPTIVYTHGGPASQDEVKFDRMAQAFAAKGYLVAEPNYRGSSGRGTEFPGPSMANGEIPKLQDIHTLTDHLVELGLANPERLRIGGWSYGGINTNYSHRTHSVQRRCQRIRHRRSDSRRLGLRSKFAAK